MRRKAIRYATNALRRHGAVGQPQRHPQGQPDYDMNERRYLYP